MNNYKLKGNESFCIREGWLNKGITAIQNNPTIFSENNAMDVLGIGSKMVKSLKFWLLASQLVREVKVAGERNHLELTSELGEVINRYDKYFEDIFTLWILHYHIVKNAQYCIAWNLFYNKFDVVEFSKENMANKLFDEYVKLTGKDGSRIIFEDDCNSILKMYTIIENTSENVDENPEDNLSSPFAELGLIKRNTLNKGYFSKARPELDKLDRLTVLYVIVDNMTDEKKNTDIDSLLSKENNIGRVFDLDRDMIYEYLDRLRQEGYIDLNRTAGLDTVYLKDNGLSLEKILEEYYKQYERDD